MNERGMEHKGLTSKMVLGAIKYKNIVRLILVLLILAGIVGLQYMNKDEFPTFEIKQGLIAAVYPGADVHEVERWASLWRTCCFQCRRSTGVPPR